MGTRLFLLINFKALGRKVDEMREKFHAIDTGFGWMVRNQKNKIERHGLTKRAAKRLVLLLNTKKKAQLLVKGG